MKFRLFTIVLIAFAFVSQTKAEIPKVNYVFPVISADLSLNLVSTRRDPAPYTPGYGTSVKVRTYTDADGFYDFTPRAGSTGIGIFGYSPYAACDGLTYKIHGYYYNCDYGPCRMYAYLSIVISGNTYYMYWPAYRQDSGSSYTNFLQPA